MSSKNLITVLLSITVVVLVFVLGVHTPTDQSTQVACTEEAIMCPDGTRVGRAAPACEFAACAYSGPYTGEILEPINDTYYLSMRSDFLAGDELYSMPIDFSLSSNSTYTSLVNQTVSIQGKFVKGNTLMVTSFDTSTNPTSDSLPKPVEPPANTPDALSTNCIKQGGTYDGTHKECTGIDENSCKNITGTWNECGSACRHNPKAEMCTLQCVQYCQL